MPLFGWPRLWNWKQTSMRRGIRYSRAPLTRNMEPRPSVLGGIGAATLFFSLRSIARHTCLRPLARRPAHLFLSLRSLARRTSVRSLHVPAHLHPLARTAAAPHTDVACSACTPPSPSSLGTASARRSRSPPPMPPSPSSPSPAGACRSRSPPPMPRSPSSPGPAGAPTGVSGWCGGEEEKTGEFYVHPNNIFDIVSHF